MARKERGVFQIIFKHFWASIKPAPKPKLVGEDYNGTKYYEAMAKPDGPHRRPHRFFEPLEKEDHTQDIPAVWEAWLRHRRKEAPTVEEVNKNLQNMMNTKANAEKLNEVQCESKGIQKLPVKEDDVGTFPQYEEYTKHEDYQLKFDEKKKK